MHSSITSIEAITNSGADGKVVCGVTINMLDGAYAFDLFEFDADYSQEGIKRTLQKLYDTDAPVYIDGEKVK